MLCYHNIVPDESVPAFSPGSTVSWDPAIHMSLAQFERQLGWLRKTFDLVSLEELITRLRAGRSVRRLACLTFDDGYVGFFRWALPVLRSLRAPATVFLVAEAHETREPFWWDHPDIVRRATPERRDHWLTDGQGDPDVIFAMEEVAAVPAELPEDLLPASLDMIRRHLGPDLTVGAHTCRHRCLTTLSDSELHSELQRGATQLAHRLGSRPRYLAYPYGVWDSRVRDAARDAAYEAGLTLDAGHVSQRRSDFWALPRVNIPGGIPDAAFEGWVSGLLPPRR